MAAVSQISHPGGGGGTSLSTNVLDVLSDLVAQAGAVANYAAVNATGLSGRQAQAIERLAVEAANAAGSGEYTAAIQLYGRIWKIAVSGSRC